MFPPARRNSPSADEGVEGTRVVVVFGPEVVVVEFFSPTEKRGKQHDRAKAANCKQ